MDKNFLHIDDLNKVEFEEIMRNTKNIKLQWDTKDISKSGIIGNPQNASSFKGEKLTKVAILTIEKIIKELKLL